MIETSINLSINELLINLTTHDYFNLLYDPYYKIYDDLCRDMAKSLTREHHGSICQQDVRNITHANRYTSPVVFGIMLTMLGVSEAAKEILISDDLTSLQVLVSVYHDDLDSFQAYLKGLNKIYVNRNPPIRLSPRVIARLMGILYYYAVATSLLHYLPDPMGITINLAETAGGWYRRNKNTKSSSDDDDESDVPKLEGHKNWITFRDKFLHKLSHTSADKYLPLSYVIDETVRGATRATSPWILVPSVDLSDLTIFKGYAVHFGNQYKKDNATVWRMLKSLLLSTQPYNIIDSCDVTKNGRKAWQMLKSYFEGEDYVDATIQENLAKIRNLFYDGESPKFNFNKFVAIQMECYKRLRDVGYNNGRGVDDATMCTDLISSILPSAQLEVALSLARNKGILASDYERLVQFFKAEIDSKNRRSKMFGRGRGRGVSALSTSNHSSSSKANRKGKGRGKANSKDGKMVLTKVVEGKQIRSSSYPMEEFRKLSKAQRDGVKELRLQLKKNKNGTTTNNNTTVNAVELTTVNDRVRILEQAIVAGVANAGAATTDAAQDDTSVPTSTVSTGTGAASAGTAGSYLRNRRSSQGSNHERS